MARKPKNPDAPTPAPLDFGSLSVADASVPAVTRTRKYRDNPFVAHLQASQENDNSGKAVTVPAENVTEVKYLVRQASNDLNCGARIVEQENGDGTVTVLFAAKTRRQRRTKEEMAEAAAAAE